MTGGRNLPAEVMAQIVAKTDGVPLFVEELTKNVLEFGLLIEEGDRFRLDGPLPPLAIPSTLQDSLMARLDRLAAVKEIAQIGAAIGREFSYPLLTPWSGATRRRYGPRSRNWRIRAAVPHGRAARRALHVQAFARPGHRLREPSEEPPPDPAPAHRRDPARQIRIVAEAEPELLGHHFTRGGLTEPAIEYWGKAGDLPLRRSAFKEAIAHLGKAIELSDQAGGAARPHEAAAGSQRLKLQTTYGQAVMWSKGFAAEETKAAYARAGELATEIGDVEGRARCLFRPVGAESMARRVSVGPENGGELPARSGTHGAADGGGRRASDFGFDSSGKAISRRRAHTSNRR